jgi:hypothetical protein
MTGGPRRGLGRCSMRRARGQGGIRSWGGGRQGETNAREMAAGCAAGAGGRGPRRPDRVRRAFPRPKCGWMVFRGWMLQGHQSCRDAATPASSFSSASNHCSGSGF